MKQSAVTIGKFNGFHLGHQVLLEEIKRAGVEKNLKSVCLKLSINGTGIFTDEENETFVIDNLGIDTLDILEFTPELSHMTPEEFVKEILFDRYHTAFVVVGEDFRFGKDRTGDTKILKELGIKYGFEVKIIEKLKMDGENVSSSRIKKLLEKSDMKEASRLLGRPYSIKGVVAQGKKLGRTLGYPTINLEVSPEKMLPNFGVYATEICLKDDSRIYNGITNIGIRPSIDDGTAPTIETFIYDFNEDIYGSETVVILKDYIRSEQKFENLEALTSQIEKDIQKAKQLTNLDS